MNAPDKIYVGITDGKHYSIVGEGYPFAKEYVSKDALLDYLRTHKELCRENFLAASILDILDIIESNLKKFGNDAED